MKSNLGLKRGEKIMKKSMGAALVAMAVAFAISSGAAAAQDRAWRDCARRAAIAAGVSEGDIAISTAERDSAGDRYILLWEVRSNDSSRQRGFCEVDRRGRNVVRFETHPYERRGREYENERPFEGEYPRVKVDTDGKGFFDSRSLRLDRLDRGYVDTREQPWVALRGRNGSRITFYGVIIASDGNRELTMRITSTDRGDARGRIYIRLNGDRNEVESISLNGFLEGSGDMKAEFNRNR